MNKLSSFSLLLTALFVSTAAYSQTPDVGALDSAVPALAGAAQLQQVDANLVDARNAADCQLDAKTLGKVVMDSLKGQGLPVVDSAATPRPDLLRVTLRPEIATLKDGAVNCISWVALRAEVSQSVRLPPSAGLHPATVTLWSRGALILTPVLDHAKGVAHGLDLLAGLLARQWKLDNPALVTTPTPVTADPLLGLKK